MCEKGFWDEILGRKVHLEIEGKPMDVIFHGTDPDGSGFAKVEADDGKVFFINAGDIRTIKPIDVE